MRYIFNNFLNTLKRYKVSSLLNIIGMAVAFAAFYVIMTQVCFNLGYNKSLKDADRTFVMSVPSQYNEGKFNIFISRPLGEALVSGSSMSEGGGVFGMYAYESGEVCYTRRNDVPVKMHLERMQYSAGGLRALNFEAVEGHLMNFPSLQPSPYQSLLPRNMILESEAASHGVTLRAKKVRER